MNWTRARAPLQRWINSVLIDSGSVGIPTGIPLGISGPPLDVTDILVLTIT